MYADYVLTESGGFQIPSPAGPRLPVLVAEKGTFWTKIRVHGTPGHGSQPFRTDNALVTAAEVVRRIADYRPQTQIHESWRQFVEGMQLRARDHRGAAQHRRLRTARSPSSRSGSRATGTRAPTPRSRRPSRTAAPRPT